MRYIEYIKLAIPILLVGFVTWQAVFAAGVLVAVTDFRERTPYFDGLLPAGRVERTDEGIVLNQEPVYIDIRLPVRARSIALELKTTDTSAPIKLAWQTDDNFTLLFSDLEPVRQEGLTLYHYNLMDINYARPGHKGRFVISAPGLVPGSVVVKGASISIEREQASLFWWQQYFIDLWHY